MHNVPDSRQQLYEKQAMPMDIEAAKQKFTGPLNLKWLRAIPPTFDFKVLSVIDIFFLRKDLKASLTLTIRALLAMVKPMIFEL